MPPSPRVTVVIPAYHVGRFIDETPARVAAQTHPAHEVVVVDDCFLPWQLERLVPAFEIDPELAYAEDVDFLWRLLGVGDAIWHDGPTSRRREHGNNATDPSRAEWSEPQILRAVGRRRNFTPGLTEVEAQALDRQLRSTRWVTGWLAAGHGLTRYREWRRDTRRWTGRRAPLRLKQLLRASRRSAPLGGVPVEAASRPQRSPVPES